MPEQMLEVENLHLWRGERHVLHGVRFALARGACLEVTGANGAGKTSLLRTLCGLVYPEEGRVLWKGRDVRADLPAFHAALAYLGHEPPLKADLTARENLRYWIGIRRRSTAWVVPPGASGWCAPCRPDSGDAWRWRAWRCSRCRCGCSMNRPPTSMRKGGNWSAA
jgi:energy-coupling factor transporter ATP-binding protein EcfA2